MFYPRVNMSLLLFRAHASTGIRFHLLIQIPRQKPTADTVVNVCIDVAVSCCSSVCVIYSVTLQAVHHLLS